MITNVFKLAAFSKNGQGGNPREIKVARAISEVKLVMMTGKLD